MINVRYYRNSFTRFLLLLGLALVMGACAGSRLQAPDEAAVVEPDDPSCAYFYFSWGRFAEMQGRLEEAQDAYTKALVCDQDSAYLHQRLAYLLIAMGKKEQATVELGKILENGQDDNQSRLELAGIFENLGETERAIEILRKNIEADPRDNHSRLTLGYLYFRHDRFDEARAALEAHVAQEPDSYAGAVMLAKLYRVMGEIELAREMYDKVLGLNWSSLQALDAAAFYEQIRDYETAVQIYRRLLAEDPGNETTLRKLAGLYMILGESDQAVLELKKLREISDEPAKVDLAIGRLLLDQKKFKAAIAHLQGMLVDYPDMDIVRPLLALSYYESGDSSQAKQVLAEVPADSKEYEDAVLMLVRLYQDEGNLTTAVDILEDAVRENGSRFQSFYFLLAAIHQKNNEPQKGLATFDRALEVFPKEGRVRFEYGLYLDRIGRLEDAMVRMIEVLELEPDNPYALNYVGYTWADAGIHLDKALDYISRAVAARPDDGFIRDSLGWVHYKRAEYGKAVQELKKAWEMQPEDPTINEHLADAYLKTGAGDKAVEHYERAVQLYKDAKKKAVARRKLGETAGEIGQE